MNGGGGPARVLVADDARVMRMLTRHWLEHLGLTVEEARDGMEAVQKAECGEYALVLCDINMPGISGLGVLDRIRSAPSTAGLPVVLLTTLGAQADVERGMQLGATAYLTKPLQHSELVQTVQRILAEKSSADADGSGS
jgi:CheY-like chemotaxis protein